MLKRFFVAVLRRNVAFGVALGMGAVTGVLTSAVVSHSTLWTGYTVVEAAGASVVTGYWLYELRRLHTSL